MHVGCRLTFGVEEPTVLALQVAPARSAGAILEEQLTVTLEGAPTVVDEVATAAGGRLHVVTIDGSGTLDVRYEAALDARPPTAPVDGDLPFDDDTVVGLRQSRYCPSDALGGFAGVELGDLPRGPERAGAIAEWVFERLAYEPGSSGPLDTAIDTLVANAGVCRDFAHLTIALCRAEGIPARLVAVYAPGLSPMDFHAVVEARVGQSWEVLDATRLAPRHSLVRIATGRDAADTAFATTLSGEVTLLTSEVTASVDGDLPVDDHRVRIVLA